MGMKYGAVAMMAFGLVSFISLAAGNVALGVAELCFLIYAFKNRNALQMIEKSYYRGIAIFMAAMLVSALCSGDILKGFRMWGDFWFWRLMPFFIITLAVKDEKVVKKILAFSAVGLTISALYAIFQWLGGAARPNAFYGHPMTLAGWLCIYVPMFMVLLFEKTLSLRYRQGAGVLFVISMVALLCNATRGAWVAVGVVTFLLLVYYLFQKRTLAILALCLLIGGGAALTQYQPFVNRVASITDTRANSERFLIWNSAFQMFKDHPVLGVGLGQYKENYQQKYISPEAKEPTLEHAHNNFMQMLAENGAVGFAGFIVMLAALIGIPFRRFWKEKNPYALIMCASAVAIVLQGGTEYNFGNSAVMKCFWLVQGCLLVLSRGWSVNKKD